MGQCANDFINRRTIGRIPKIMAGFFLNVYSFNRDSLP